MQTHIFSKNEYKPTGCRGLQRTWMALLVLCILGVGYALVDVNFQGNAERYGALGSYLLFNDDWGTHRGYICLLYTSSIRFFLILIHFPCISAV